MPTEVKKLKPTGKLSVLVPAYNESGNIEKTLRVLGEFLADQGFDYEIVVVDDGSRDQTAALARNLGLQHVKVVRYETNMGKGYAVRAAFFQSSGDVIAFFDAGLDFQPEHIINFWKQLEEEQADVVIGSKRHPKSQVVYPMKRRIISSCGQLVTRTLFNLNVRDTQVGMKVWRRPALQDLMSRALVRRYAFDIELLSMAQRYHYKIVEAPVKMQFNATATSVNLKAIWRAGVDTLAVFYRLRLLKYYDKSPAEREQMLAKYRR